MAVDPHKTNFNVHFWGDCMKDDVTVTSQRIRGTMLGCKLRNLSTSMDLMTPDSFVRFPSNFPQ